MHVSSIHLHKLNLPDADSSFSQERREQKNAPPKCRLIVDASRNANLSCEFAQVQCSATIDRSMAVDETDGLVADDNS